MISLLGCARVTDIRELSCWENNMDPQSSTGSLRGSDAKDPKGVPNRRRILTRVIGAATVGAAGGAVLTDVLAPAARASTITESGAVAPAVVFLTDASTIAVNASLGNDFRVTLGASRTMGNPTNPSDGQQIVFQITQGGSGADTITWGSSYQFSTGVPQPTLSTAVGETDLLGFVYNAAIGNWLLTQFVKGFAGATASPSPSPSMTPTPTPSTSSSTPPGNGYRLFPSTNGPSSLASYSATFEPGVVFEVTAGGTWFEGYWWWVAPSGQSTASQEFVLWSMNNGVNGTIVPGSTVSSGTLTPGQWNYIPLQAPIGLTIGTANGPTSGTAVYVACTSFTGNFPQTSGEFNSSGSYNAGITNGPLTAYSDTSGTAPSPFAMPQGVFGVGSATAAPPVSGYGSSNFWMDVQVSTTPPAGASYRIWPGFPYIPGSISIDTGQQTTGTEFWLSESCTVDNIWFYSPPGAGVLPSRCGIFSVATQTEISGSDNSSPSWQVPGGGAASPGDGWVYCSYSAAGVVLPTGKYKVCIYTSGGSEFYQENVYYFSAGPGKSNIVNGPLTCPSTSNASSPGNSTYQDGPWSYPDTFDYNDNGENRWIDIEVTPTS